MVATLSHSFRDPSLYISDDGYETASLITGSMALPTGAGLLQIFAYNSGSAAFLQIWDGYATPPTDGGVMLLSVPIGATAGVSLEFTTSHWLPAKQGLVAVLSSDIRSYVPITSHLFVTALWTTR